MFILLILGTITLCTIILWLISSPFYWRNKGVPYLIPLPVFGNSFRSLTTSLNEYYNTLYNKYPNEKYYGFHFFIRPTLLLRDPELIKDIYIKDFEYFTSNGFYTNEKHDPLGGNLLFIHGQEWKEIRSKLSSHFTPFRLRSICELVEKSIVKMDECITTSINNNESIQIEKFTVFLATDVIVQAVFGIETDCFNEKSYFSQIGKRMFSPVTSLKLLTSIISPEMNNFLKINIFDKDVTQFLSNIFNNVIEYRKTNKVNYQDFAQAMMNLMETKQESGEIKYFPDKTVVPEYNFKTALAQALILIAGGAESAAMTMAFFLYEIALNEELQEKCRQEIMHVLKENGVNNIQPEQTRKLTYLDMAIKETMRKYPPFIITTRECTKAYKFRGTNLTIEPGTLVLVPTRSLQMDSKHYPEPEKFLPERFANEKKGTIDPAVYLPWGLGPRTCIGKNFAKLEMFLVLSRLLQKYRFKLSSKTEVPIKLCRYTAVITPKPAIWLDVKPI